jgi:hypothetical protein
MATRFQKAIKLPVHIELAIRSAPVKLDGRTGSMSKELKQFHNRVSEYLPLESEHRRARALERTPQDEFYNSVQWAVKELKTEKRATGVNYKHFEATVAGLDELRNDLLRFLYSLRREKLEDLMAQVDGEGIQLFVALVRQLPAETLGSIIKAQHTRRRIFTEAFRALGATELVQFLKDARLPIRDALGPYLRTEYRV